MAEVVIEIPRRSRNKYEWDEAAEVYRLNRVLSSAVFYNFDYGFIVDTRAKDGDHTDAVVLIDEPLFPGCHLSLRPVGVLEMADEHGLDFKVIGVAVGDPLYAHVNGLDEIEPHRLTEIENFFATYKLLEDKAVEIKGWSDAARAREILLVDRARHQAELISAHTTSQGEHR